MENKYSFKCQVNRICRPHQRKSLQYLQNESKQRESTNSLFSIETFLSGEYQNLQLIENYQTHSVPRLRINESAILFRRKLKKGLVQLKSKLNTQMQKSCVTFENSQDSILQILEEQNNGIKMKKQKIRKTNSFESISLYQKKEDIKKMWKQNKVYKIITNELFICCALILGLFVIRVLRYFN